MDKKGVGGHFIPAGIFIDMGIGFLMDQMVAIIFIGLGTGVALFGLSLLIKR